MPDDTLDPPDADRLYRNYLETCRRLGVDPVPRERAAELIAEWSDAIAAARPITDTVPGLFGTLAGKKG